LRRIEAVEQPGVDADPSRLAVPAAVGLEIRTVSVGRATTCVTSPSAASYIWVRPRPASCVCALSDIYRSGFAGTNKATALCWAVGSEFDRVLASLRSKGVAFEHYNLPGVKREGDVHTGDGMRVAWFKDPDGNVLNIIDR
jgi:hypothetical protein